MKIYTRTVTAWRPDGSPFLENSDSFEYEGQVTLLKDSPSPPPPIDYVGAANAQGSANLEVAQAQAAMNNPNVNNPYGSQQVFWNNINQQPGGAPIWQPTINQTLSPQQQQILDSQQNTQFGLSQLAQRGLGIAQNQVGSQFSPGGQGVQTDLWNNQYGQPTATDPSLANVSRDVNLFGYGSASANGSNAPGAGIQMNPNLFAYGTAGSGSTGAGVGVRDAFNPVDYGQAGTTTGAGLGIQNAPTANQYGQANQNVPVQNLQTQVANAGQIQGGPSAGQYGQAGGTGSMQQAQGIQNNQFAQGVQNTQSAQGGVAAPNLQTNLNYNGPGLPTQGGIQSNLDTSGVAQMPVNGGMTAQNAIMSRLQPQIQRERDQLQTQLRNQGLVAGGEAYNNDMTIQNQRENDLLSQAALQGVNVDMAANQQGFGQALSRGQFSNQAQGQGFGQGLDVNQQGFNQAVQSGQFGNEAQMASFGAGLQNREQSNQAIAQNFGQNVTAAQLQNQAVGQNFGQNLSAQQSQNQAIGQNFGQGLSAQQLQNQAVGQNFGQGVTAAQLQNQQQQQQYGQNLSNANFSNQAGLGLFGMGMENANLFNQGQNQNFENAIASNQAQNAAQAQAFGQQTSQQGLGNQAIAQNTAAGLQKQEAFNQAQQQRYDQLFGQAGLSNQAIAQNQAAFLQQTQAQNAAQQQGFGQRMDFNQLQNQAILQNQGAASQQQQAQNQAVAQQYNQQMGSRQFMNQAQQQQLQQQMLLRSLPLNEITALMSGSQINNPQFQPYNSTNVQPTPVFNAAQAQGQNQQNLYNQQVGQSNANTSGLYGVGAAAALGFFSDRRLKSNISRIATLENGLPVYEYDIFGHREVGVMADDVMKVIPEAVHVHPSGYMMVDYGRL